MILTKKDVEYLLSVLKPLEELIPKLEKFRDAAPDLPEQEDTSHCDGSRLTQTKRKRFGLQRNK